MKTITYPFTEVEFKEAFANKASVEGLSEDAVKEVLEYINGLNFEQASTTISWSDISNVFENSQEYTQHGFYQNYHADVDFSELSELAVGVLGESIVRQEDGSYLIDSYENTGSVSQDKLIEVFKDKLVENSKYLEATIPIIIDGIKDTYSASQLHNGKVLVIKA